MNPHDRDFPDLQTVFIHTDLVYHKHFTSHAFYLCTHRLSTHLPYLLNCIDEIGPLVTQSLNLILRLPLRPHVSESTGSLLVLSNQQNPLKNTTSQQEKSQIGQDGAMARQIARSVFAAVYVGGDDAVEISPANNEAEGHPALVNAFDVIGGPGDGIGNARIDPQSGKINTSILNARVSRA